MKLLPEQMDDTASEFWIKNFQFELFYNLSNPNDSIAQTELDSAPLNQLPTEMLSRIFSYLTAVDLLVVRDVCIRWGSIVEGDKALWNHVIFTAVDFDVKVLYGKRALFFWTTASLVKEMPLLRKIHCCNVNSAEDMSLLITALCDACWELHHIQFPESCNWHPSAQDLHQLMYYHPRVESLQLCTKQKLTPADMANFGIVLSQFQFLHQLKLVGFYWYQPELLSELLPKLEHITSLSLPSFPGLSGVDLKQLQQVQLELKSLTLNISSLTGSHLRQMKPLSSLQIIDSSALTTEKLKALGALSFITSMDVNLTNSSKESVLDFFNTPRPKLTSLRISNCGFSNILLEKISKNCCSLQHLKWLNTKDVKGEITDDGILAITKLPLLQSLDIKSRSVTKAYYTNLSEMRSLKYARINGMKVPGCL